MSPDLDDPTTGKEEEGKEELPSRPDVFGSSPEVPPPKKPKLHGKAFVTEGLEDGPPDGGAHRDFSNPIYCTTTSRWDIPGSGQNSDSQTVLRNSTAAREHRDSDMEVVKVLPSSFDPLPQRGQIQKETQRKSRLPRTDSTTRQTELSDCGKVLPSSKDSCVNEQIVSNFLGILVGVIGDVDSVPPQPAPLSLLVSVSTLPEPLPGGLPSPTPAPSLSPSPVETVAPLSESLMDQRRDDLVLVQALMQGEEEDHQKGKGWGKGKARAALPIQQVEPPKGKTREEEEHVMIRKQVRTSSLPDIRAPFSVNKGRPQDSTQGLLKNNISQSLKGSGGERAVSGTLDEPNPSGTPHDTSDGTPSLPGMVNPPPPSTSSQTSPPLSYSQILKGEVSMQKAVENCERVYRGIGTRKDAQGQGTRGSFAELPQRTLNYDREDDDLFLEEFFSDLEEEEEHDPRKQYIIRF
ncbi:UNVERIFIED_CONTAM: hypothetical protein K2H54_062255 [Gekko kuhli]